MHSVEKREILSHQRNISSNQFFSNLFSLLLSRNCCQKCVRGNSHDFQTVEWQWISRFFTLFSHQQNISWKKILSLHSNIFSINIAFGLHEIFVKKVFFASNFIKSYHFVYRCLLTWMLIWELRLVNFGAIWNINKSDSDAMCNVTFKFMNIWQLFR